MWDFVKNIGSWTGDLIGLDGSFGLDKAFGTATGSYSLGNLGDATAGLFNGGSDVVKDNDITSAIKNTTNSGSEAGLWDGVKNFAGSDTFKTVAPAAITGVANWYSAGLAADAQKDALKSNREMQDKYFNLAEEEKDKSNRKSAKSQLAFSNSF